MTRLEKLLMRVELIDRVTAPANRVIATVDKLTQQTAKGFAHIAGGAAGLYGVGFALENLTGDARTMHRAMGEVASLSVADDALKQLQKTAIGFSIRYGESAADFVRSSYDIQSSIAGLVGSELATFTEASNILAKGTKADAGTITNYMGTMYGIFKRSADAMGKANWVQQLTGQTAQAVEMFKTNGVQMSGAFTALGADATAHGIAINEQMAVLGKLQATMSGSEAGTKYKAFLRGVGSAQEKLGMQFTDSAGRMLPVDQILSKLQNKFGAIDTVAKSDLLKKAFGSDEAVAALKLMIADTGGLSDAITTLGNVNGMDKARAMAENMVDPLDRLNAASTAVKIGFGSLMEKAMLPYYESATENLGVVSKWVDKYPHLFGVLAKFLLVVLAVTAAVSALAIIKGIAIIATAGLTTGITILRSAMVLVRVTTWAWGAALGFVRAAVLATAINVATLGPALAAMRVAMLAGATSAWAFAAALLANPITWIVLGVVALIAGLVMLVTHWEQATQAGANFINAIVEKWTAFRGMIEDNPVLKFLLLPLLMLADGVGYVVNNFDQITAWFSGFKDWLSNLDPFAILGDGIDWLIEKINLIPGINIESRMNKTPALANTGPAGMDKFTAQTMGYGDTNTQPLFMARAPEPVKVPVVVDIATRTQLPAAATAADNLDRNLEQQRATISPTPAAPIRNVPNGGLMNHISNNNSTTNRGTSIGTLNVNTTQAVNGYSLRDELLMAGG